MRLVKDKKVVKLHPVKLSVKLILQDALKHAHEMDGVIIIEIPKASMPISHRISYSPMKIDRLTWAMKVADGKLLDILSGRE